MFTPDHPLKRVIEEQLEMLPKNAIVFDIGTSKRFAKEVDYFREILEQRKYLALGYNPELTYGNENCDLNGDILALPLRDNSVDAVMCVEVLEHVASPVKTIAELYRVIKPKGTLILTTPFLSSYHGKSKDLTDFSHAGYPDFWRFTYQGLEHLCGDFRSVEVYPFSSTLEYYLYHVAQWEKLPLLRSNGVKQLVRKLQKPKKGCATSRHLVIAKK